MEVVRVHGGLQIRLSEVGIPKSANVLMEVNSLSGSARFSDLQYLKDVVLPEGTEAVGHQWFRDYNIESVMVPISVRVIGFDAFRGCARLKCVTFQPGSMLEGIGEGCFCESGLEEIAIPSSVVVIHAHAFRHCG